MSISEKQEAELYRIYEKPILRKLGLSVNFPRTLLYVNRNAFSLGLLKPRTIIAQQRLRMYVGHMRIKSQTHTAFQNPYELIQFNSRLSQDISMVQKTMQYWRLTWTDEAL